MPSLKVPMEPPSEGPSNLRMVRRQVEHDCARRVLSLQPVLRPDDAVDALRHDACHAQVAGVLQQERRWLRETNRIAHLGFVRLVSGGAAFHRGHRVRIVLRSRARSASANNGPRWGIELGRDLLASTAASGSYSLKSVLFWLNFL